MRDENGFKMHTSSESHVRQMLMVGEDTKKYINDYSNQFQRDFLQLLRTSHGEKKVHMNHFYQEYISNKSHIHLNSTKWPSLTEYAKFVGREGICRVEEDEKGIHIAWIDNSPEALRRQDAIRKKERQDKGDEEREQMLIREQVRRARLDAEGRGDVEEEDAVRELKRAEGEKITLSFGAKPAVPTAESTSLPILSEPRPKSYSPSLADMPSVDPAQADQNESIKTDNITQASEASASTAPATGKISMKVGLQSKPKNVFALAKKSAVGGKKPAMIEQPKKMSEAERIMKEELERKRGRESSGLGLPSQKKQRF